MIELIVARNPYDRSARTVESVAWVEFGVVGDYLPDELADQSISYFLDGVSCDVTEEVPDGGAVGIVVVPDAAQVGAALVNILVATAISYTFSLLFGRPAKPVDGDDSSATYAWTGVRQNDRQGSPVSVAAGKIRMGGTVIGEYVEAQATPPKNVLFQLVALGEGPFKSIAGVTQDTVNGSPIGTQDGTGRIADDVFIDDERAGNIRGITMHVRLGTVEQKVVEWFRSIRNEHAIGANGRTLTGVETESADNSTLSFDPLHWYDGGNFDLWDEHGISYTFDEVADECAVRIRFPRGMFRTTGAGAILSSWIGIQIRYRELDAIGGQIKSGGMNGDGWVYLPPVLPFPVEQRDAFEFQQRFEYRDKDQYVPPGDGSCFDTLGNIAGEATASPTVGGPASGVTAAAFSASTWVNISTADPAAIGFKHIFGDFDEATLSGWSVGLHSTLFGGVPTLWRVGIEWGDGTTKTIYGTPHPESAYYKPVVRTWVHLAISYTPGDHIRLYVNGQPWIDEEAPPAMTWGGSLHIGRNPDGASTDALDMQADDFLLWDEPMIPDHVAEQVAIGRGRYGTGYTDALRCWYTWEPSTGATQKATDPWFGDAVLAGGAAISAGVGILPEEVTGPLKPGRYHVEVVRINERSTAPETSDLSEVASFTAITNTELTYPGIPLVAYRVEATDQLSSSMPPTSVIPEARKWPVWDGGSTVNPSISSLYTKNQAWICYGLLTNASIGLGRHYTLADVDLIELKAWADHCDEVLTDGSAPLVFSASDPLSDIRFHSFEADPETGVARGAFEIIMPKTVHGELPAGWGPDSKIILQGLPTPADEPGKVFTDPNGGYEIYRIDDLVTEWAVWCWWDRKQQVDPWANTDALGFDILQGTLGSLYPDALVQGGIPRFEFNGNFDTHGSAWEAIIAIAATARAAPIPSGNKVRFRWSAPRPVTAIIGRGSIIPGSFKMTIGGGTDDTNAYDYTFLDQTRSYERTAEEIFDETIIDTEDTTKVVKRSTDLFGVTHPKQAERHLRYDLRARRMLERRGTFDMTTDGLPIEPGDIVQVSHDVLPRGVSGRLIGNGSLTQVVLDQPVTFEAGKVYTLALQNVGQGAQKSVVDVAAMGGPGTYPHGTTIEFVGLSQSPFNSNPYILTTSGEELTIEIGSVRLAQDMTRSVEFIEYKPEIFTDL